MRWACLLLMVSSCVGCFGSQLRVMLDFFPNPNHVPLYVAQAEGFLTETKVELLRPADPSDPVKLAATGQVDLAITPQINYLIAKGAGLPLIAVAALIDGALGGLLSLEECGVKELSDLRGRRVGYSLAPLEPVLWRTMLASVGVGDEEFQLVNVRMNTVAALLSHGVDAIGAFRNFELIEVELLGKKPVFFPQEDYGVPNTYELLLVANPVVAWGKEEEVRRFISALGQGVAFTCSRPEEAFYCFVSFFPELDDELNRRAFLATLEMYARGARHDDEARWEGMQGYLLDNGLMERGFPLEELYTRDFLP